MKTEIIKLVKALLHLLGRKGVRVQPNLTKYLVEQNIEPIKKYNTAQIYQLPAPIDLLNNTVQFLPGQNQVGLFDRYLVLLNDIKIHTQEGYIELEDNSIIIETTWSERNVVQDTYFDKLIKPKEYYKQGKWFSTLLFWSWGYYHWICDILPRFYMVLEDLPMDTKIIIPANAQAWQIRSLELIGIERERMVAFSLDQIWKLQDFYFAPPVAMTGDHMNEAVAWVSDKIVNQLGIKNNKFPKERIYISRGLANKRRIVNEEHLISYLKANGFKIVQNEVLSFDEQVQLYNSASIIVAPHGAGLTNMMFSKAGTAVLEIFEKGTLRRCYWTLAHAKKINYTCFLGNSIDIGIPGEADIEIEMDIFEKYFDKWINEIQKRVN